MSAVEIFASLGALLVFILLTLRPSIGVAALLAFYPLQDIVPDSPIPGLNAETVLVAYAMILTLGRSGMRVPPLRVSAPVIFFALIMFAAYLVGRTVTGGHPDALEDAWWSFKLLKSQTFGMLLFFITYWWIRDRTDLRRALEGISIGLLMVALAALADFDQTGRGRLAGFFSNANITGDILAIFLVCPLHLFWHERSLSPARRAFYLVTYAVVFVAMVLTLSRGAWLAAVAGHMVWLFFVDRRLLVVGIGAAAVMLTVAMPVLPETVRERIEKTFTSGGSIFQVGGTALAIEGSAAIRVVFYRIGWDMFLDSPVWGHGHHSYKRLSVKYGARYGVIRPKSPHSLPLKLAAENGAIGILAFSWIVLAVMLLGQQLRRIRGPDQWIGVMMLCVGAATGAANLFHTDFLTSPVSGAYFWALLGFSTRRLYAPFNPAAVPVARTRTGSRRSYSWSPAS